jgi:hypothetical protein
LFSRSYVPALGLVAILAACSSNTGTQLPDADFFVSPGQAFGLQIGQTAGVLTSSATVLVRFNGVTGDNRCPVDVQCVVAGAATSRLTVQTALNVRDVSLDVPPSGSVQQEVDEITLVAVGIRPDAEAGVTINPLTYVIGLNVLETGSIPLPQ